MIAEEDLFHALVKPWEIELGVSPDPERLLPKGFPCREYPAVVGEPRCNFHSITVQLHFFPWAEWHVIGSDTVRVGFLCFKIPAPISLG